MNSIGLPNLGNTCYINSIIQCLRYQRNFVNILKHYNYDHDDEFNKKFIDLLFSTSSDIILKSFITKLASLNNEFKLWKQCDAHEFFLYLIDDFYEKHKLMFNPFKGEFLQTITCPQCSHKSNTTQDFITLSLPISKETNVEKMIEEFEKEDDVIYKCEKCTNTKCKKKVIINKYPSILAIHIKRFTSGGDKIETAIVLKAPNTYRLVSICNHAGTLGSGHYTAAVKKTHEGWLLISDSSVQSIPNLPEKSNFPYILFFERYKRKRKV